MSSNRARQGSRPGAGPTGQSRPATRQRRPRPLPPGDAFFTPGAAPGRQAVEQRSATSLLWLHQAPRWLLPLLSIALLVTGLAVGGWGGALALAGVGALLGWLAAVSWPRLTAQGRVLRLAAIGVVLVIAVIRGLH